MFDFLFRKQKRFDNFIETTLNSLAHQWYLAVTTKPLVDAVTDRIVLPREDEGVDVSISFKPTSDKNEVFTITFCVEQVCKTAFRVSDVRLKFGQHFEGTGKFFVRRDNGAFGGILLDPRNTEWMSHVIDGVRSTEAYGDVTIDHFLWSGHVFVTETGTEITPPGEWQPPKIGDPIRYGRYFATVIRTMRVANGWLVMTDHDGGVSAQLFNIDGTLKRFNAAWKSRN